MIIITAKKDGFRRCGMAHNAKPVQHQDDAFTPAQLKQLQAEPMLVVDLVADDEPKEPGPGGPLKEDVDVDPAVAEAESQAPEEPMAEQQAAPAAKKGGKKASEE